MRTQPQTKSSSTTPKIKTLAAMLGGAMVISAGATDITLVNPSIENPSYNFGGDYPGWYGVSPGAVSFTGWSGSAPGASPAAYDGSQGLWSAWGVGWCGLYQNSTYTVQAAGETLTAGVWAKTEASGNVGPDGVWFHLELWLDGSQVTFAQPSFAAGTDWTQITASYVTTAADIGKTVGIEFGTDGGSSSAYPNYTYMDLASLTTVAPVPEPSTTALSLLGGLGFFAMFLKRRK